MLKLMDKNITKLIAKHFLSNPKCLYALEQQWHI